MLLPGHRINNNRADGPSLYNNDDDDDDDDDDKAKD